MNDGQNKQPTIFLIEEDDETRRPLVNSLRSGGYRVLVAVDEAAALDMVGGGGVNADLVLVNLIGKSAREVLSVGRRIRDYANHNGHMPLVVMPEKYDKDVEGTEVNLEGDDWIFYLGEESDQLKNFLTRLLS